MKTKILTLALCLTGILAQNIQAQTTSEPISIEEATEFWTAFKKVCKEKDTVKISQFINDSVLVINNEQGSHSEEYYNLRTIKENMYSMDDYIYVVPVWSKLMSKTNIDKKVEESGGNEPIESGGMTEGWNTESFFGKNPDNANEYIFSTTTYHSSYTMTVVYYFRKTRGVIFLYKKSSNIF